MKDYSIEKIRQNLSTSNVSFTGRSYDGAGYAEVYSTVLLKGQPRPIKVDYMLRRDGAGWKIYDLDIDSISVMANYRNQFLCRCYRAGSHLPARYA